MKMSKTFEKDLEQIINTNLNQNTLKSVAEKIYTTPFKGGLKEGLNKTQIEIVKCLNGKCSSKTEVLENTNASMNHINDWLSMIIAQNIVQKVNGKNFMNQMINDSCPYKTNRKSPRKKHQGSKY